ncbi:PRC-barrel domain-containing protein [Bacillus taeanensis]|uniref:PRC-barrel domain-containing protein n=1 Tax=Bacillus taeanensis TaxID=273032 RepID=UPI0015F10E74|nr:PRC-barrel domain-containing protein [Bacillus taeanensis]
MRTFNQLKKLPVYLVNSTDVSVLGSIEDLLFDQIGEIKGFKIDVKGFLQRDHFLPFTVPFLLEEEGLIIYSRDDLMPMTADVKSYYSMEQRHAMMGKPVVSEDGEQLGLVKDVYFQEHAGTIEGIEMTEGWFTDMTEGLKQIKFHSGLSVQNDILIVKNT